MMEEKKLMVFQTDFGYRDSTVAAMYGVIKSVDRHLEIIDSTHELPKFDIWSASYRLFQAMRFWPEGTIFVSVVDPGVGTKRRACAALTCDGYLIVTPDNGTLTHVGKYHGIREIRMIDETVNRLHSALAEETSVFHGRDLFGYCAAKLAANLISFEETGPAYSLEEMITFPIEDPEYREGYALGMIEIDDPNFGNLFTDLETKKLLENGFSYGEGMRVLIRHADETVFDRVLPFSKTFAEVREGEMTAYNNELMRLSFAVSMGNFMEKTGIGFGNGWTAEIRKDSTSE